MHIKNIGKIMQSEVGLEMQKNENYIDYKVVDTWGNKGGGHMLLVFFDMDIPEIDLQHFMDRGRRVEGLGEMLDDNEIHKMYGRVRMIIFS